jgi:N-methylhydantoinase A
VPRHPGILCAFGLLGTDLRYDLARTRIQRAPDYDIAEIARTMQALEEQAEARLESERIDEPRRKLRRAADLRYAQQGVEITVDFSDGPVDAACIERLVERFHALHERLYTFADREAAVEIVNLRVTATGRMDRIELPRLPAVAPGTPAPPSGRRPADLDGRGIVPIATHRRDDLLAGHVVAGPAIVDQLDSTTLVGAGRSARVDTYGNLLVTEG